MSSSFSSITLRRLVHFIEFSFDEVVAAGAWSKHVPFHPPNPIKFLYEYEHFGSLTVCPKKASALDYIQLVFTIQSPKGKNQQEFFVQVVPTILVTHVAIGASALFKLLDSASWIAVLNASDVPVYLGKCSLMMTYSVMPFP